MSLLAELKRRRVFRVAAAYLVGAWLVLQVSDVVFPALRLPLWTLTLMVVVVMLGFPVALLLGWAFDITPGGIERTPGKTFDLKFPFRAAAIGTLIVSTGVLGFVGVRRRAVASSLDPDAVAVLPFRVLGDANLMVMREGMVDLVSAKMTGEGGARAIDSRTTLALWRKTVDSPSADLAPIEAMQLARKLGAGHVLLGEMVGTSGKIAVTAKLYSAVSGAVIESVEETASPNDMLKLVDRVVTKLLSRQAGEAHRVEALLSESLPAVRAYLDGMRLYRIGSQDSASARFKTALQQDSTFALAGMYLALARTWSGYGPDYQMGRRLAFEHRARLPQRDREMLEAWVGPDLTPQSPVDQIVAFEQLTARYPDMVDAWYNLGDRYYHMGALADVENHIDKALAAWSRALTADSTYAPAYEHLPVIYGERGDTVNLRRVANRLYSEWLPEERLSAHGAHIAALGLNDRQWLRAWRANLENITPHEIRQSLINILAGALPQQDLDTLLAQGFKHSTNTQRVEFATYAANTMMNFGRHDLVARYREVIRKDDEQFYHTWQIITPIIYPDADTAAAHRSYAAVQAYLAKPDTSEDYHSMACFAEQWRVRGGDLSGVGKTNAGIRAYLATHKDAERWLGTCPLGLDIMSSIAAKSPALRTAVERADSLLLHRPFSLAWREHLAYMTMQGYSALGDYENALKVARRAQEDGFWARSPLLLERARLARRTGRHDEAIASYRKFLKLYAHATGNAQNTLKQARIELEEVVGEKTL
ncbi:MAG TPA: hypothetical protein VFO52_11195 [Longimicrobiales bacterium]|nr:hypothetical protein [Longimicrobiales bacterium]